MRLQWDRGRAPSPRETVELRVPAKVYFFFQSYEMKDIKALRPQQLGPAWKDGKINGKEVWKPLMTALVNFYSQPYRWDGKDHVIVTETYETSSIGFPGDLHSAKGSQGLWRPIRSHLLSETADLDMKVAMPTILLWVCKQFGIACPCLEWYVNHREEALTKLMTDDSCTRPHAKEQFNLPWTWDQKLRGVKNAFFKAYDTEAKRVQQELMARPELVWILPFCNPDGTPNRAGSFVAKIFHFVQARLIRRVMHLLREEGEHVACIVFDGLSVADQSRHGDEPLLAQCTAACEEVCPGINMGWAWKELDYEVRTKDKKVRVPDKSDGKVLIVDGNLCIPDGYAPPDPPDEDGENGGAGGDVALDARFEPTYDEMYARFSLPDGEHGKMGTDFIEVLDEDDVDGRGKRIVVYAKDKFIAKHEDLVYYTIETKQDNEGNETQYKKAHAFIPRWIKDPKKDPRYLRDPSRKCKWDYFDMHPDATKCPDNCYNLFRPFAAESMAPEVHLDTLEPDVKNGLDLILGHIRMLCEIDGPSHENFLLDMLAHLVQHPSFKFGVMCCLVGRQGLGKQHIWDMITRMVGSHGCFETTEPERDVWGDNNDNMRTAFVVRIAESDRKSYAGKVGKVRNMITDPKIRVRSLYGAAANVRSFFRAFGDSNDRKAFPDTDNERRFFMLNCNSAKVGDSAYFNALATAIRDDRVIRSLYLWLKARGGVKERYTKDDIPVSEYGRELKASTRPVQEKFLVWLVEQQPLNKVEMRSTGDDLWEKFKEWREQGGEFQRSKQEFLDWLRLGKFDIPGIRKHRPYKDLPGPSHIDGQSMEKQKVQVTEYVLNLTLLRKHYHIGTESTGPGLNLGDSVLEEGDDEQVVGETDEVGSGGNHDTGMMDDDEEDEENLEPEERGRRIYARNEPPPSPHPENEAVWRGYNQAATVAAAGTSSLAGGSTAATPIVVFGVSAGRGAHDGPQTQKEIDERRAARQQKRQQQQTTTSNGKQRARPRGSVADMSKAKKPREGSTATAAGIVLAARRAEISDAMLLFAPAPVHDDASLTAPPPAAGDSSLTGGSTAAAPIVVPDASAGRGPHDTPQVQEGIDQAHATRQHRQQQQTATGKQRVRPDITGAPQAKKQRKGSTATTSGTIASVALVHKGRVLLTKETRSGKTQLNLPGGKGKPGESLGQTAARDVQERTGLQLSEHTLAAIAGLAHWVECGAKQGYAAVLHLADGDPDGTVNMRFDRAAANGQRGSKTAVREGLEWHTLADVRSSSWRNQNMNFTGQHRAAAAMRAVGDGPGAVGPSGGATVRGLNLAGAVAVEE